MPCPPATSPVTNRPGCRDPRPRTEAVMGGRARRPPENPIRNDAATISIIRPPSSAR
ncbi:hypothetical protein [Methanoculleus chikugoensis]|uniref:hypothetical protein n=1 Tax=Methanoculleus chikugoensis TaxID=118126 RepID=UPI001FB1C5B9|nr:hypothetical protein [Methanoculleus chikugoensis]